MSAVPLAPEREQGLPASGRVLLATFDDDTVLTWQAHHADVAAEMISRGRPGGTSWRTDRVTRMRTSLPSLLARCDWGRRPGRERILGLRMTRAGFDAMLRQAVHGEFEPEVYATRGAWQLATRYAAVTLTWHPDRDAGGHELARQTVRIGVRDDALRRLTTEWVTGFEDFTPWVEQARVAPSVALAVPVLRPYPLPPELAARLAGRRA